MPHLVSLHALSPFALYAHDRNGNTEVELLIHRQGREELGNHAVNLQLHLTLQNHNAAISRSQAFAYA